jgi:membrane protein insertase Oxa1/YidC/SpoIIIJ
MIPWFDGNDCLGAFHTVMPKDPANIPQGVPTWGLWEHLYYLDDQIYNLWMRMSSTSGLGLCGGLVITAFTTRMVFFPLGLYSQTVGYKMKQLAPDID